MKYLELLHTKGYHSTIATTFCTEFSTYEGLMLPRLREAGSTNNLLVADARMLAQAMQQAHALPSFAGRSYSLTGIQPRGVFHSKVLLQLGETQARLVVASANVTASGVTGNLEVVGALAATLEDTAFAPLIRSAMHYIAPLLATNPSAKRQLDWALAKSAWLKQIAPAEVVAGEDGRAVGFFGVAGGRSIARQFVAQVRRQAVRRLVVVSPYWDDDLSAVRGLASELSAQQTYLVLNPSTGLFPAKAMRGSDEWHLRDLAALGAVVEGRFSHAKVVVAQTDEADHVLFGSANCTDAALSLLDAACANAEACIYREMAPGAALLALGLQAALEPAAHVAVSDVRRFEQPEAIPLQELAASWPGCFSLNGTFLTWSVSPAYAQLGWDVKLEFLDKDGETQLELNATAIGRKQETRSFGLDLPGEPYFVRVHSAVGQSGLAVVQVERAIGSSQRRTLPKLVREALDMLEDDEAVEGLWVLEALQKLEAAEEGISAKSATLKAHTKSAGGSEGTYEQTLDYLSFIAGRASSPSVHTSVSTLVDSHRDSVRDFLNHLLGQNRMVKDDEECTVPVLPMGDETGGAVDVVDDGADLAQNLEARGWAPSLDQRHYQHAIDNQTAIVEAVEKFLRGTRLRASGEEGLHSRDILRFRVLLMVVLFAGTSATRLLLGESTTHSRRQVLPSKGNPSWRNQVGRMLFAFFRKHKGTEQPLLRFLSVSGDGDAVPVDLLETWVLCCWAACSALCASGHDGTRLPPSRGELELALDVYEMLQVAPELLKSDTAQSFFDAATARYGKRLGIDKDLVNQVHAARGRLPAAAVGAPGKPPAGAPR